MKFGILSDTHNLLRPEVLEALAGVDAILHAGDISSRAVLDRLGEIAPVYAVRGNADKEWAEDIPPFLELELGGPHIYMTHRKKDLPQDISPYDLVVVGHSHQYSETSQGHTLLLNPGSCGPRRFHQPITLVVAEVEEGKISVSRIEIAHAAPAPKIDSGDLKAQIEAVIKETEKGRSPLRIAAQYGIDPALAEQMSYLKSLFSEVYLKDIVERKRIRREDVLAATLDLLCSSVGSLTNPNNIANSLNSRQKLAGAETVAANTVKAYLGHLADAYLFEECRRFDVKGKDYFDYPNKYYCEDMGLRNARIGFRQQEMTHIMENILYNDLRIRGCEVDIGIVYGTEKNRAGQSVQVAREIDFIAHRGGKKTYIQSAYAMETETKAETEKRPLTLTGDSFPKIVVRHDIRKRWYDDNGVLNIGILDFLLDTAVV